MSIGRTARALVDGVLETRGAPILNPVTGAEHRVRIEQPNGFEFAMAEIGRGWSKTEGPVSFVLDDTYGQFCPDPSLRRAAWYAERMTAFALEALLKRDTFIVRRGARSARAALLARGADQAGTGMDPFAMTDWDGAVCAPSRAA
jgi:hypothetical protein